MQQNSRAFEECLRQILASRELSASRLSQMLGHKSRTTVYRALQGEAGPAALMQIYEELVSCQALRLTTREAEDLREGVEISRFGGTEYRLFRVISDMLMGRKSPELAYRFSVEDREFSLPEALHHFRRVESVDMLILGCCERSLMETIVRGLPEDNSRVRIRHYIYIGGEKGVRNISAVQPLLYLPCYEAYGFRRGDFSIEREQMLRSNHILMQLRRADGRTDTISLVLDDTAHFFMDDSSPEHRRAFIRVIENCTANLRALKMPLPVLNGLSQYVEYFEASARMEHGKTIYSIRPDIPLAFMRLEHLRLRYSGPQTEMMLRLRDIHIQRYENVFQKRQNTHIVLSLDAMRKFAQTGVTYDHFFAMKPFSKADRVAILTNIREQAVRNRRFHLYFLQQDMELQPQNFTLFEGSGLLMSKPGTHYDLSGDHAEVVITDAEFCEQCRMYFLNDLLARRVRSRQETLSELAKLIEMAQQGEE